MVLPNAGTRRLVPADLLTLRVVGGLSVDARMGRAAYVVTTMTGVDDAYLSSIRIVDLATRQVTDCTHGTARDLAPQFSPDGRRLLFLSDRGGRRQVWLVDLAGGDPYAAPELPGDVVFAEFSPEGRRIAAIAVDDAGRRVVSQRGWRRLDRMRYRADGAGYLDDNPKLWVIDVEGARTTALTDGAGAVATPAWSPDGSRIAFVGEHRVEADSIWHTELWSAAADASEAPHRLCTFEGAIEAPAWSPDGAQLAFLGFEEASAYAVGPLRLYRIGADGAGVRCLMAGSDWVCGNYVVGDLDATPLAQPPIWTTDGDIFVLATARGSAGVRRVRTDGSSSLVTGAARTITGFGIANRHVIACASDSVRPPEIYAIESECGEWQQLTDESSSWCSPYGLSAAEPITVRARSGRIDAWRLGSRDAARPRPAVLEIHGGPHFSYGDAFMFEFQLLAAAGIEVVFCNPRGSQGYGDDFASAVTGDWAAPAFDDCADALDAAIARGGIDTERLGVAGGSYGGYLTAWTIAHTDRFKAAIAMRPALDLVSLWGTSEVGRMLEHEIGGLPDANLDRYAQQSPLMHAGRIATPLLLIHAEHDFRCPIGQSEQLFTALKRRGATVEFLRFSSGDHGLSRYGPPRLRIARLEAILDWFDRYLGTGGTHL